MAVVIFESERHRDNVYCLDLLFQTDQHDVIATGLEGYRFTGNQNQLRNLAHFHDVILHCHLVQFDMFGDRRGGAHQFAVHLRGQEHERASAGLLRDSARTQGSSTWTCA